MGLFKEKILTIWEIKNVRTKTNSNEVNYFYIITIEFVKFSDTFKCKTLPDNFFPKLNL